MATALKKLRTEVAEKFQLKHMKQAGEVNHPTHGLVDLSTVKLPKAKKLAADPTFKYLVAKPKKNSEK